MFTKIKEVIKEVKVIDETRIKELESEIRELKAVQASEKRILEAELEMKISRAVDVEKQINNKLQRENSVLNKQVEILEKAFENMGFDVKDMKEILNKLVDGLVSKNEMHVVR